MAKSKKAGGAALGPVTILGGGNVGRALARGWVEKGRFKAGEISITRRHPEKLAALGEAGFHVGDDNRAAIKRSREIIVAVQPQQLRELLLEVRDSLDPKRHTLISVVSGATIRQIAELVGEAIPIVRAMPNTAISIGESMTCLAAPPGRVDALNKAKVLFEAVGTTAQIDESMMEAATALCACGIAFFLRSVRAASQGGIEIGFHPEDALMMAAQTAKGAAGLLLRPGAHPESEIDRVTTPRGCTIAGLNEMEHQGFSSALIKGITTSARKAVELYRDR
jgi:pyrroline-5-carboxylate reductase